MVSVPDGPDSLIDLKDVYHYKETLGVWSYSTGTEDKQYKKILDWAEKWTTQTASGMGLL